MPSITGPHGAIEYHRDRMGYPSLSAPSMLAGTYALGYLHATDRLTQVTLTSLAGRGELMTALSEHRLARLLDRSVRTMGLQADVPEQVQQCDAPTQELLRAYSDGFNAGAEARGVPWVLKLLGVEPFRCSPEGILSVFRFVTYFGLTSMQLSTELIVAELAARGAPMRVFERLLGPKARGLDLESLSKFTIPREFSFFGKAKFGSPQRGSNAFCVSGVRSASGSPLLAGEFHMEVGRFPPLLYAAHLGLPNGEYMSGITIPGLAWFAAGRTRHVAWSYTYAHADNVDFLVERVQGEKYWSGGEWRPLRRREETVKIRNKPSETWTFYDNDYGRLVGDASGAEEQQLACVRVSGISETHRAFSAARRVIDCRNVDDLMEVQRALRSVSLEAILVDRQGSIASIVTGQIDARPSGWTGAYPRARGDGDPSAPGVLSEEQRPIVRDPECGYLASANQGGHGPHRPAWCTFPEPLYRFERINQLLAGRDRHDLRSLVAVSYDTFDGSAARLIPIWAPLMPEHPLREALRGFVTQQHDRTLLALFHTLHLQVCLALLEDDIGREAAESFREWAGTALFQVQLDELLSLQQPERLDEGGLKALLARAFPAAIEEYQRQREVPVRLRFKHLVTQGKSPAFLGFDSPEVELPGTPVAPFQARASLIGGETVVYAPAFHLACDMADDHAYYNLPGGASESRFGVGYGQGVDDWLEGRLNCLTDFERPKLSKS
ncbi:MAG: penicillin acylase family protein [Polyangiaceae bacterium]